LKRIDAMSEPTARELRTKDKSCRDPAGHFIGRDQMFGAWGVTFLDWIYGDAEMIALLTVGLRFCERKYAEDLQMGARVALGMDHEEPLPAWAMRSAERWQRRRDVLIEALRKMRGVA
jgi:hypothetical protein